MLYIPRGNCWLRICPISQFLKNRQILPFKFARFFLRFRSSGNPQPKHNFRKNFPIPVNQKNSISYLNGRTSEIFGHAHLKIAGIFSETNFISPSSPIIESLTYWQSEFFNNETSYSENLPLVGVWIFLWSAQAREVVLGSVEVGLDMTG